MGNAKRETKAKTRKFRRLEELNLLDDFLFQEVVASPEVGEEFCKILLRVILGKEIRRVKIVPQRSIQGTDTGQHGVRLDAYIEDVFGEEAVEGMEVLEAEVLPKVQDIYDFEPNKVYEKKQLPRKMRYYHGLIDTKLLETGVNYDRLPNVFIIMILPYDPFDKKRMVYTIKNKCEEDNTVSYEDGAVKLFLYTKGTEGNPGKNLIDMLKYIENSTEESIVNQDIKRVDELVRHIKKKKEVDISYMKSWEWEEYIKRVAAEEGREEGREEGIELGRFQLLCEMVREKEMTLEGASKKMQVSAEDFSRKMQEAGF